MTTDRFFAEPVAQDLVAWSWPVVDRQIGRPVGHAHGLGEERHRRRPRGRFIGPTEGQ